MTSPRHRGDHHPVLAAGHPRCAGLKHSADHAQVQRPPAATPCPSVVTRAAATTHPAPVPLSLGGPYVGDQQIGVLVELNTLDHGLLDAQQAPP